MSLATASCDLWQNEQRSVSSEPVRGFIQLAPCGPRRPRLNRSGAWPVNDLIDDAVLFGLRGVHDEITFNVALDAFERLPGMSRYKAVGDLANTKNLASVDIDISGLAGEAAQRRLMNEDA